jgi:hypothetical protein
VVPYFLGHLTNLKGQEHRANRQQMYNKCCFGVHHITLTVCNHATFMTGCLLLTFTSRQQQWL